MRDEADPLTCLVRSSPLLPTNTARFFRNSQDFALVRTGRSLEKRVRQEGEKAGLKCGVKYWDGAWVVDEIFHEMAKP